MNLEQRAATQLLLQKQQGFSVMRVLARMKRRYLICFTIFILASILVYVEPSMLSGWYLFMIGLLAGMIFRDLGWILAIKKSWSFTLKITDWEKVTQISQAEHNK